MFVNLIIAALLSAGLAAASFADAPGPERDLKYDTRHERNVLDFWPAAKADKPAPVFIWFHGGGFRNGDKSQLEKNRRPMLETYRKAGYAVVTCNYPFLSDDTDHLAIATHCARRYSSCAPRRRIGTSTRNASAAAASQLGR